MLLLKYLHIKLKICIGDVLTEMSQRKTLHEECQRDEKKLKYLYIINVFNQTNLLTIRIHTKE